MENVYETEKLLGEYLVFHYGAPEQVLSWEFGPKDSLVFPKRCAELCVKHFSQQKDVPDRALDIGCAVGRSSFEMARTFNEVIGIDYSHSFIKACEHLRTEGSMEYKITTVGDLVQCHKAQVDSDIDRSRCRFQQGDACNLPATLGEFGCVLAANLICRLHTPKKFLQDLSQLVAPGGVLVITSPYTFMREYTPRENWLGGFIENGKEVTGYDGLRTALLPNFEEVAQENMPFFIRETARKNQWTVAHATVWRRKR